MKSSSNHPDLRTKNSKLNSNPSTFQTYNKNMRGKKRRGYSKPRTGYQAVGKSKRGTSNSFLSQSMAYSTGKL